MLSPAWLKRSAIRARAPSSSGRRKMRESSVDALNPAFASVWRAWSVLSVVRVSTPWSPALSVLKDSMLTLASVRARATAAITPGSSRARNTQRAYLGHWTRFHRWAREQGLDLPGGLEAALCDYLVRLAEDGKRMATIRQARAAIIKGAELAGWPNPGGPGVAEMMRGLGRILRGPQRQAAPLHAEALAAIRATAFTRRRTRGGHTETAEYARRRGLVDVALASVMRDGLLRVSEAAALRWGDVELAGDGSGRIRIPESKTGQEAEGVVLYLGLAAVEALLAIRPEEAVIDAVTPVFNLHPDTIRRRLQQAARAAGLPGWRDITGHSGRLGMAQDLSAAGFALPELMTAGRWKSPRMPARYTERQTAGRGAVARYYQGGRG